MTLTQANVAAAQAASERHLPQQYDPGRYEKTPATPIGRRTGNLLAEDGTPLTSEVEVYLLQS